MINFRRGGKQGSRGKQVTLLPVNGPTAGPGTDWLVPAKHFSQDRAPWFALP